MPKSNWINTSPNSGNNNGSIQVTTQANNGDSRQDSIVVSGGGLYKTINVNQHAKLFTIGGFGWDTASNNMPVAIQVTASGTKGIARCQTANLSIINKEFNNTITIAESEHYVFVSFDCIHVNNITKEITFNMPTTLDFVGNANMLCKLFIHIRFMSAIRNPHIDVVPFYERLVYEINNSLMTSYPNNDMFIYFNIVDFNDSAKERIRSMVTCDRLTVTF